jgi:hypothetical protein
MPKDELGRPVLIVPPLDDFEKKMSGIGREKLSRIVKALLMTNWSLGAIIEDVVSEHGEVCACMGCQWVTEHIGELGEQIGACPHMIGEDCPFCEPVKLEPVLELELPKRGDP